MLQLLAATDFSKPAGIALDRAISLASLSPDASLTLMHVYSAAGFEVVRQMLGKEAEDMERSLIVDAESRLRSLAARYERILGRPVHIRLSRGNPEAEIVATATQLSVDLVIMGARGKTPARRFFLGGTIERVIQKASGSVLAVRRPASGPYKRVLVAVGSNRDSRAAVEFAFLLNPGAEVMLLHAFEAPFEEKFRRVGATNDWMDEYRDQARRAAEAELEQVAVQLDTEGIHARRVVVHGSAAPAIVDYARRLGADLIVVGKHRRSILGDMLPGNIARRVALESKIDVLVASSLTALGTLPEVGSTL